MASDQRTRLQLWVQCASQCGDRQSQSAPHEEHQSAEGIREGHRNHTRSG